MLEGRRLNKTARKGRREAKKRDLKPPTSNRKTESKCFFPPQKNEAFVIS